MLLKTVVFGTLEKEHLQGWICKFVHQASVHMLLMHMCESSINSDCNHVCLHIAQTDTASVLLEAIGYIKFLQEQVQVRYVTSVVIC